MKRLFSKQFENIVFITLVVAGALALIMTSRDREQPDEYPSPSPTATAKGVHSPEPRFIGVPEAVLETHLLTSELYKAEPAAGQAHTWTLTATKHAASTATITYALDDNAVSLIEFSVALPPKAEKGETKTPQSAIEKRLLESGNAAAGVDADALGGMLSDVLQACDCAHVISQAECYLWTQSALDTMLTGKAYKADGNGCRFHTYVTQRDGRETLVCMLYGV